MTNNLHLLATQFSITMKSCLAIIGVLFSVLAVTGTPISARDAPPPQLDAEPFHGASRTRKSKRSAESRRFFVYKGLDQCHDWSCNPPVDKSPTPTPDPPKPKPSSSSSFAPEPSENSGAFWVPDPEPKPSPSSPPAPEPSEKSNPGAIWWPG